MLRNLLAVSAATPFVLFSYLFIKLIISQLITVKVNRQVINSVSAAVISAPEIAAVPTLQDVMEKDALQYAVEKDVLRYVMEKHVLQYLVDKHFSARPQINVKLHSAENQLTGYVKVENNGTYHLFSTTSEHVVSVKKSHTGWAITKAGEKAKQPEQYVIPLIIHLESIFFN